MRGIDLIWAGGENHFLLEIPHLRALQKKCDAGPPWILARLSTKQWHVDDVIEPIRLGLEGGGMPKEEARKLVEEHVEAKPLYLSVVTAQNILMSALYGAEEDQPGEAQAGAETMKPTSSREDNGASPSSTNGQVFSDSTSTA